MAKKSNRETITMGHPGKERLRVVTAPTGLSLPEVAQLRDAEVQKENRTRFAELIDSETEAANAAADEADIVAASGLYGMQICPECKGATQTGYICPTCSNAQVVPRSADPGSVVGLDGFTPTVDTPVDGDTTRTDPDPS